MIYSGKRLGFGATGGASEEPPSRMTWFFVGVAVTILFEPIRNIAQSTLGLGHAGLSRAHKRIAR